MEKWSRMKYMPCAPLGEDGKKVSCCKEHTDFTRRAAADGMVLLKNDGVLPLKKGAKVAVFGKAQVDHVTGVHIKFSTAYVCDILDGLCAEGFELFEECVDFYRAACGKMDSNAALRGWERSKIAEPEIPEDMLSRAAAFSDTAIMILSRRQGEDADRRPDEFYLTAGERKMIDGVCGTFENVVVLLNIGAAMETAWIEENSKIGGALLTWYPGMEGGKAVADVLTGAVNPSGKLVDTFARRYEDYPSATSFGKWETLEKYYEDIYVGYRFFETVPGAAEKVVYFFGYGLSYTTFAMSNLSARQVGENILAEATVKNTGTVAGKEVVQLYFSAPQGVLGKPARVLAAFQKTKLLVPGEEETVTLSFRIADMASYDDLGKLQKSAYVLEQGEYAFYLGNSVRNTQKLDYVYSVEEPFRVTQQLSVQSEAWLLEKRMRSDGSFEMLELGALRKPSYPQKLPFIPRMATDKTIKLDAVARGEATMDDFIAQLDRDYLIRLLGGKTSRGLCITNGIGSDDSSMTEAADAYGVPCAMTFDDPYGVFMIKNRGAYATLFPCATLLACTWDPEILTAYGSIIALEATENNLSVWLAPAMNIHRDPLCGRSAEYFSEDPLITGQMAAAAVRGCQSRNVGATPKHFAANNREANRHNCDSVVSERALREIYLKGFEICVKESDPWVIMTAYNLINGTRAPENYDLLTNVLRGEWGFNGLVVTDWSNQAHQGKSICAGNDVRMPIGFFEQADEYLRIWSYDNGIAYIQSCARRVLELLIKLD